MTLRRPDFRAPSICRGAFRLSMGFMLMLSLSTDGARAAEEGDRSGPTEVERLKNLQEKLKTIILPAVDFDDATLREALDFLRKRSVELDTLEEDPKLKGVNILLLPNPDWEGVRLTLKLKGVPLGHALKFVAELSGGEVRVDPSAVVISKKP